jgi:hypothetical protein
MQIIMMRILALMLTAAFDVNFAFSNLISCLISLWFYRIITISRFRSLFDKRVKWKASIGGDSAECNNVCHADFNVILHILCKKDPVLVITK